MQIEASSREPTPRNLGYRMPAEWERHAATWLAWPHNVADWPGRFQPVPWVYCEIVRHLSQVEDVHILVNNGNGEKRARGMLARTGAQLNRIFFHSVPTNRSWLRDSGPIFLTKASPEGAPGPAPGHTPGQKPSHFDSGLTITNWKFNAWAKYDNWQLDDQIPIKIAGLLRLPSWTPHFPADEDAATRQAPDFFPVLEPIARREVVLEGGSIDVNGTGSLLTTEECLLSGVQQRNPDLRREEIERLFYDYLAIDQVLWMNRGIAGDDTHGHIDDITRFVAPQTIVTATEQDSSDPNHLPLAENLERLRAARGLDNKPFRIVELPMPAPVVYRTQRLPASYLNFYIANGLVLVPTFNDPRDREALNILAELFPDRQVVGIYCGDLVWGLGTLHCMTQQQPA